MKICTKNTSYNNCSSSRYLNDCLYKLSLARGNQSIISPTFYAFEVISPCPNHSFDFTTPFQYDFLRCIPHKLNNYHSTYRVILRNTWVFADITGLISNIWLKQWLGHCTLIKIFHTLYPTLCQLSFVRCWDISVYNSVIIRYRKRKGLQRLKV